MLFELEDSLAKQRSHAVSVFAMVIFSHLICNLPLVIPTLALVRMSMMSWHIFLRMLNCSLFVNVVANSLMLPLCPDFFPNPPPHVNVDDHKEHLVGVAMEVDIVTKIVKLHLCSDQVNLHDHKEHLVVVAVVVYFPHVGVPDHKERLVVVAAVVSFPHVGVTDRKGRFLVVAVGVDSELFAALEL